MKIFLAIASGFLVTLGIFASGVAMAVVFLTAGPVTGSPPVKPVAAVMSGNGASGQDEMLVRHVSGDPESPGEVGVKSMAENAGAIVDEAVAGGDVDATTTASLSSETDPAARETVALASAHIRWCMRHYQSYDPSDDSYTPYSGGRRRCISPATGVVTADAGVSGNEGETVQAAYSDDGLASLTEEHIQSCYDRYRSYRAEDNSYQPYGGGPRKQCQ